MILYYILITFTILIYIERMIINDIVSRLQTLIIERKQMDWYFWIEDLIDVHVVLYLFTDFIGGCMQLYLISWFTQSAAQTKKEAELNNIDELNAKTGLANRVQLGKNAVNSILTSPDKKTIANYEDFKIPIIQNKNFKRR